MGLVFVTNQKWASSLIRGKQVAERLNVPFNPDHLSLSDTAILVKTWFERAERIKNVYLDIGDSESFLQFGQQYPDIHIIAITNLAKEYISQKLDNDIVVIPEHHCNFEGIVRNREAVMTAGYVGSKYNFTMNINDLTERLKAVGINFIYLFVDDVSLGREDICNFYKQIDIQITFRNIETVSNIPSELKNPLKLTNAGSFKIPTVGYPEPNYVREMDGCFIPAENLDKIVEACLALKEDEDMYKKYSELAFTRARHYHIDRIIKLYKVLEHRPAVAGK
ncbi:MAG: glycosyltransferase family 4 protein [Planctomycetes bacterium]|nr:glycosyltransferase family 4 protein [Planctomycetota bacterium]